MSTETVNAEHEKLIEVLKFTPRTYKIQMWGYGGEKVMGTVDRKIYDYFRARRLDVSDYCWDSDYADEHNIPEEMQPFPPGSWYDCDSMAHVHGVSRDSGTLQILDENENVVYERSLVDILGGEDDEPKINCFSESRIEDRNPGEVVFLGVSSEKGTFFEGEINLTQPFDITKLELIYDEVDDEGIINTVYYDEENIDNYGGSTDGKSSDFGFYLVKDSNSWDKYSTMDDIQYSMTDWFPKKITPVRTGNYEVRTTGRGGWETQAKWTGGKWVTCYASEKDYNDPDYEVKIKEWRGIAYNPDEQDLRDELDQIHAEFINQKETV